MSRKFSLDERNNVLERVFLPEITASRTIDAFPGWKIHLQRVRDIQEPISDQHKI